MVLVREIVWRINANAQPNCPEISNDCTNLALALSECRAQEIRAGTIPLVPEDMRCIGLDVHNMEVWEIYTEQLPRLYEAILGRRMRTDLGYDPRR